MARRDDVRDDVAEPRPPRAGVLRDVVGILELQRPVAVGVALAVAVIGFAVAVIAPGILPAHPVVGAAVGAAAVTIGIVAAVAADAADATVRGVRHVRPTGAAVAAWGGDPVPQLTAWVADQLADRDHVRIAVAAAGTDTIRAGPIAGSLGRALSYRGNRVLIADLSAERAEDPGIAEVGRGELRLSQAVEFAPGVDLAWVRSGSSLVDALAALPRATDGLAGQVEVLIVALPGLHHPGALLGATAAERSLLLVIEDSSTRVEMLAGIQALETARAPADLVVLPSDLRLVADEVGQPQAAADEPARAGIATDELTSDGFATDGFASDGFASDGLVTVGPPPVEPPLVEPPTDEQPTGGEPSDDPSAEPTVEPPTIDEQLGLLDEPEEPSASVRRGPSFDAHVVPPADEPPPGEYEELQRIAAVVALERELAGDDDDDDTPGGAA